MRGRCVPAKTREEADRLQMNRIGQSLSRIQTVEHDPAIPLHAKLKVAMREKRLVDAAADSMREFVASGDYDRLPSEWEEAKKKPDTPVQPAGGASGGIPGPAAGGNSGTVRETGAAEAAGTGDRSCRRISGAGKGGTGTGTQCLSFSKHSGTACGVPAFRHEQAGIKHKKTDSRAVLGWSGCRFACKTRKKVWISVNPCFTKQTCVCYTDNIDKRL